MMSLIEFYIKDDKDAEAFGQWAFGDEFKSISGINFMNAWNERHSDKLELKVNGDIPEDIQKMIEFWEKEKIPFRLGNLETSLE